MISTTDDGFDKTDQVDSTRKSVASSSLEPVVA